MALGSLLANFGFELGDVIAHEVEVFVHGVFVEEGDVFHMGVADDDEGVAFFDVEFAA